MLFYNDFTKFYNFIYSIYKTNGFGRKAGGNLIFSLFFPGLLISKHEQYIVRKYHGRLHKHERTYIVSRILNSIEMDKNRVQKSFCLSVGYRKEKCGLQIQEGSPFGESEVMLRRLIGVNLGIYNIHIHCSIHILVCSAGKF